MTEIIKEFLPRINNAPDCYAFVESCLASPIWETTEAEERERIEALTALYHAAHKDFKKIAEEIGISNRALGMRYGIPYTTVSAWTAGKRTPPTYVLLLIQIAEGMIQAKI